MSKQYECNVPVNFKDIMGSTRPLMYPEISINLFFDDVIYMNELFFYKCLSDNFIYQTKDTKHTLNLYDFQLCFKRDPTVHISETYMKKYMIAIEKQNIPSRRIAKVTRIDKIKQVIKNVAVKNLNYGKKLGESHYRNI